MGIGVRTFHATLSHEIESSMEQKFQGAKVPHHFRSRERKFQGAKVPPMELAPGSKSTWE